MSLPDLADVTALQTRLGRTLTGADLDRAQAAISDVSAMARAIARQQWPNGTADVSPDVVAVVLAAARRLFLNPDSYLSQTAGPFTATRSANSVPDGVFSVPELSILKRFRPRPGGGLSTIATTRGEYDWETGFVADDRPGSDPIAWYAAGDPGYADADHYPGPQ